MGLAVDARLSGATGIGRYIRTLLGHLDQPAAHVVCQAGSVPPGSARFRGRIELGSPPFSLREQVELPVRLAAARCRLLHSTHVNVPLAFRGRRVTTIFDCAFDAVPDDAPSAGARLAYRLFTRLATRVSTRIITGSESARADVLRYHGADPSRIRVIPIGLDLGTLARLRSAPEGGRILATVATGDPFALHVGQLRRRKNIPRLLEAVRRVNQDLGVRLRLVLAGPPRSRAVDLPRLVATLGLDGLVVHAGWVTDAELVRLYAAAALTVMPSRYEGFGLPVLEAMACETPVVAADIPALREVASDAALFVPPHDPAALAAAMASVLTSESLRADLIARGQARVLQFPASVFAERTAAVYAEALDA